MGSNKRNLNIKFYILKSTSFTFSVISLKTMNMARYLNQQEVILITGSRFANRQHLEKDAEQSRGNQDEKFREACWNGMLKEMLPEIFLMADEPSKLFLWQMREAQHVLALQMAEFPIEVDKVNSIDPYCFIDKIEMS